MTDLERIELAIRRTAERCKRGNQFEFEVLLNVLANEIAISAANKQGHSAKVDP